MILFTIVALGACDPRETNGEGDHSMGMEHSKTKDHKHGYQPEYEPVYESHGYQHEHDDYGKSFDFPLFLFLEFLILKIYIFRSQTVLRP